MSYGCTSIELYFRISINHKKMMYVPMGAILLFIPYSRISIIHLRI